VKRILHRSFASYEAYVETQGHKARTNREALLEALPRDIATFQKQFTEAKRYLRKGAVLCLGARTGAEVQAAINMGYTDSVGLDLHPVGKLVIAGDWHRMPLPDASYPNVFSNSLDHCWSLEMLAEEIRRVLQPGGRFYLRASDRWEGKTPEAWLEKGSALEALYWQTADDLRDALVERGFKTIGAWRSGKIWGCYVLEPMA
jgi:SAM-dependent methyltransferase